VDDLFDALVAPARRLILDELTELNGQSLYELCTRLALKHQLTLSRQAISQHLAVLEAAGLISVRREGRFKYHDLNTQPLHSIVERWLKPKEEGEQP
jgi:DNA-binding transcriptional ArsR family regulator